MAMGEKIGETPCEVEGDDVVRKVLIGAAAVIVVIAVVSTDDGREGRSDPETRSEEATTVSSESGATAASTSPSTSPSTTAEASTTATSAPWSADAIPPEGVAAQLSLSGIPHILSVCAVMLDGPGPSTDVIDLPEDLAVTIQYGHLLPRSVLGEVVDDLVVDVEPPPPEASGRVEVLDTGLLCGSGWPFGTEVVITISDTTSAPAGELSGVTDDAGAFTVTWTPQPGRGLGPYPVQAAAGGQAAATEVEVVASEIQRVVVLGEREGVPGSSFLAAVAGFPPGEQVSLHIYRLTDSEVSPQVWEYVGSTGRAAAGEDGGAVFEVATHEGQAPGAYCFIADGMAYTILSQCSRAGISIVDR